MSHKIDTDIVQLADYGDSQDVEEMERLATGNVIKSSGCGIKIIIKLTRMEFG